MTSASTEPPNPPYIVPFEGGREWNLPLALVIGSRSALPLFDDHARAAEFIASGGFGGYAPVELTTDALVATLRSVSGQVEYVAVNPPPAGEAGIKVRMGGLTELADALAESRDEVDLFDFLAVRENEDGEKGSRTNGSR
ncbi:hypothetical protein [Rubrobacter indicoceani]|uniref:hypothetical protein n=1 Tax=Rubrobacter indicoceani TaxID=2051957 RepID=UPI000E5C41ED|nr:hypothetical protein [Rubrobacter indicoceani]